MTRYYNRSQHTRRFDSVSYPSFNIISLTIIVLVTFLMTSCEKGPTMIGNKLLPGSDFVLTKAIDTLIARSYTRYDDSVRTDSPSISYMGQIYDPYFGTTSTGFVSQLRLGARWDGIPFTLDSVMLFMHLLDVKQTGTPVRHTLKLSEISEQIYNDKAYYSNQNVPLTGYETSIELPILRSDTINNIEIKLPNSAGQFTSLGEYITRDTSMLFHSNVKPDFRSYFRGLYFQIVPSSDPLLISLSLVQEQYGYYNNVLVLYITDINGVSKEYSLILDATNKNASFNTFSHDFSTALPGKKILHINDGYRDTLTYLQSLNGVYTRITLPGLTGLKNDPGFKGIAVNKARLVIPVSLDGVIYKKSTVPPRLQLRYKTTNGNKYDVPDYGIGFVSGSVSHPFFDGTIDTVNNVYNFNIPRFVQGYLDDATGQVLPELELYQGVGEKNVILRANNNKVPVKFEFTYTKF